MKSRKPNWSLAEPARAQIEACDLELFNEIADELTVQIEDVLQYQSIEIAERKLRP